MILYSETLEVSDLERIADELGIRLYGNIGDGFYGARRRRVNFTLRPRHGSDTFRAVSHQGRRIFAVSWAGHYAFLARVFDMDPHAEQRSAIARYNGREQFLALAPLTANVNVGSQIAPMPLGNNDVNGLTLEDVR